MDIMWSLNAILNESDSYKMKVTPSFFCTYKLDVGQPINDKQLAEVRGRNTNVMKGVRSFKEGSNQEEMTRNNYITA